MLTYSGQVMTTWHVHWNRWPTTSHLKENSMWKYTKNLRWTFHRWEIWYGIESIIYCYKIDKFTKPCCSNLFRWSESGHILVNLTSTTFGMPKWNGWWVQSRSKTESGKSSFIVSGKEDSKCQKTLLLQKTIVFSHPFSTNYLHKWFERAFVNNKRCSFCTATFVL